MSEFMSRDILPELWNEILKRHWSFLETEESVQKLEERHKLDTCLKEFLCIVQPTRKFFLPETAQVLRKTLCDNDYSIYETAIAFEYVSQYANNLFAKPWRKEFRTLKLYCGFYKHEIHTKLVDALKLFEAMGYRRMSDEIYVLDGPICPDQVANVSRDALTAYIECQIIDNIYSDLLAKSMNCTRQDVLNYREKFSGGCTSAVKDLSQAIHEHRLRKEKLINLDNSYATIQHSPEPPPATTSYEPLCQNCTHVLRNMTQQQLKYQFGLQNNSCAMCTSAPANMYNSINGNNSKLISSYPVANYHQHGCIVPVTQPHMSHSRSLEYSNEPHATLPHRHSIDHQQQGCAAHLYHQVNPHMQHLYESTYDCLDGVSMGSSASYAAVANAANANYNVNAHPYNVSGNRYPLPHTISSQLSTQYAMPAVSCNGVKGVPYDTVNNYNYQQIPPLPPARHTTVSSATTKELQALKQCAYQTDHIINFDDRAPLTSHDFHAQQHMLAQHNNYDCKRSGNYDMRRPAHRSHSNAIYAQPKDVIYPQTQTSEDINSCDIYACPTTRSGKLRTSNTTDNYVRNLEHLQDYEDNNRKSHMELKERNNAANNGVSHVGRKLSTHDRDTSDASCESAALDDFIDINMSDAQQESPTFVTKNNEGFGSFESWNFVFKKLDRSNNSNAMGNRDNLLVESLDLEPLHIDNSSAMVGESKSAKHKTAEKSRTLEKTTTNENRENKSKKGKQEKSILKHTNANNSVSTITKTNETKSALKKTTTKNVTNNNNDNPSNTTTKETNSRDKMQTSKRQNANNVTPTSTQIIVSSPNEWSCRFCTFMNPDTVRICEMCSKTKDSMLEPTVSKSRPTCV